MHNTPRARKAYNATNALGISDEELKPVLQNLFNMYDQNWEFIEDENYRALIDAYFQSMEEKQEERKRKAPISCGDGERPKQKLRAARDRNFYLGESSSAGHCNKDSIDGPSHPKFHLESASTSYRDNMTGLYPKTRLCSSTYSEDKKKSFRYVDDITKGSEKVKISLLDETGSEDIPKFNYIPTNMIFQSANVNVSLARIADEDCCSGCSGDCLSMYPCACSQETGGEFAYTSQGLLTERFLTDSMSRMMEPQDNHHVYCKECPIERTKNETKPEPCKGHMIRKFIKECWRKCGCDMQCGNRVVQRGISCKLQVFLTPEGKGWGVRTLEALPKGSFVCEYVGEILTNTELYERIVNSSGNDRHTYPVTLDGDWGSEAGLKDDEALCLDATHNGNVARFINHRCSDANLINIPVEVETPDRHYYHLALFTNRNVSAYEELTWDYCIDFDDHTHPIKAFQCCCGSAQCRDKKQKGRKNTSEALRGLGGRVTRARAKNIGSKNTSEALQGLGGPMTRACAKKVKEARPNGDDYHESKA